MPKRHSRKSVELDLQYGTEHAEIPCDPAIFARCRSGSTEMPNTNSTDSANTSDARPRAKTATLGGLLAQVVLALALVAGCIGSAHAEDPGRLESQAARPLDTPAPQPAPQATPLPSPQPLPSAAVQPTLLPDAAPVQPAAAAADPAGRENVAVQMRQLELQLEQYKFKNYVVIVLTLLVVVFGFVGFTIMWKAVGTTAQPDQFLRSFIVVIIVIAALILITAGFSNEQIAPAFGLFGTIVGYMLGRLNQATSAGADQPQPGEPATPRPPLAGGPEAPANPGDGPNAPPRPGG
eukprot:gene23862-25444_t